MPMLRKELKIINPTQLDCCYFAGIVDGKGCFRIGLKQNKHVVTPSAHFEVVGNSFQLMEWCAVTFGGTFGKRDRSSLSKHDSHFVNFNSTQMLEVIPKILPYLKLKYHQARIVFEFLKINSESRWYSEHERSKAISLANECHELNHNGGVYLGKKDASPNQEIFV
jgi:hypothetical protein